MEVRGDRAELGTADDHGRPAGVEAHVDARADAVADVQGRADMVVSAQSPIQVPAQSVNTAASSPPSNLGVGSAQDGRHTEDRFIVVAEQAPKFQQPESHMDVERIQSPTEAAPVDKNREEQRVEGQPDVKTPPEQDLKVEIKTVLPLPLVTELESGAGDKRERDKQMDGWPHIVMQSEQGLKAEPVESSRDLITGLSAPIETEGQSERSMIDKQMKEQPGVSRTREWRPSTGVQLKTKADVLLFDKRSVNVACMEVSEDIGSSSSRQELVKDEETNGFKRREGQPQASSETQAQAKVEPRHHEWNSKWEDHKRDLRMAGKAVASVLEENRRHSMGAQLLGDDSGMHAVVKAEKTGGSDEDRTGISDEANTGTSEEEKNGGAECDKAGGTVKATQKRKSAVSLVSDTGITDGSCQADAVVKRAKKKSVNVWAKTSSRKGGKRNTKNGSNQNPAREDTVHLPPVFNHLDKLDDEPEHSIVLSKYDKAEKIELSSDRLSASSTKGYRMVRATRGINDGTWYFEIHLVQLGPTGHTRLGWSTQKGDVQAPVGFDSNSYGYRDLEGEKIHMAVREKYGDSYFEGDVVGCYIHLPNGAGFVPKPASQVSYKGRSYHSDSKEVTPVIVPESEICFFRNGICQGTAFKDIKAGRYFPAASMYTLPREPNCTVKFNFGPDFSFPPLDIGSRPPPKAMVFAPYCGLAGQEVSSLSWGHGLHAVNATHTTEIHKYGEAR